MDPNDYNYNSSNDDEEANQNFERQWNEVAGYVHDHINTYIQDIISTQYDQPHGQPCKDEHTKRVPRNVLHPHRLQGWNYYMNMMSEDDIEFFRAFRMYK